MAALNRIPSLKPCRDAQNRETSSLASIDNFNKTRQFTPQTQILEIMELLELKTREIHGGDKTILEVHTILSMKVTGGMTLLATTL